MATRRLTVEQRIERAASDERRRVALLLQESRDLLGRVFLDGLDVRYCRKDAERILPELDRTLADPNVHGALPEHADWHELREQLESALKLCAKLIREQLPAGRPGVAGGRVAEVLEMIDNLLHTSHTGGHLRAAMAVRDDEP